MVSNLGAQEIRLKDIETISVIAHELKVKKKK